MSQTDTFYNFESQYYDLLYGGFSHDVSFYKAINIPPPVLEVFAGTGRIISQFRGGVGLEINDFMLKRTENKFIKVRGDARMLPLKRGFNSIIMGLNSLLLLPNGEKRDVLRESRAVASPNCVLIIDVINGFSLSRRTYNITDYSGRELRISLKMKPRREKDSYVLNYRYKLKSSLSERVENNITIYPITSRELQHMLASENFDVYKTFGDYDLSPYSDSSEKMIVVAYAV